MLCNGIVISTEFSVHWHNEKVQKIKASIHVFISRLSKFLIWFNTLTLLFKPFCDFLSGVSTRLSYVKIKFWVRITHVIRFADNNIWFTNTLGYLVHYWVVVHLCMIKQVQGSITYWNWFKIQLAILYETVTVYVSIYSINYGPYDPFWTSPWFSKSSSCNN